MAKRVRWTLMGGAVLLCSAAAAIADDLEAVEKKVAAAWNKHKSITAKMTVVSRVEMEGTVAESRSDGTYEFMRKGDKPLLRLEQRSWLIHKSGDQETRTEQPMIIVVDGEFAYTLTELLGRKTAMKTRIDPQVTGDPKAMLDELRKRNDLKLLPEETVDGRKVYVIQATPKETAGGSESRQVYCFDQETGVPVRYTAYAGDRPISTTTFSDFKFDVPIDPDRFKFKLPEGVELVDQTGT